MIDPDTMQMLKSNGAARREGYELALKEMVSMVVEKQSELNALKHTVNQMAARFGLPLPYPEPLQFPPGVR